MDGRSPRPRRTLHDPLGWRAARERVELEIEHHLLEATDALIEAGLDPGEARREAERRFGSRRRHRDALVRLNRRGEVVHVGIEAMARLWRDVRVAARGLARNPRFAVGVLLTFALGIGVNGAMFAVTDRLILRPPPHVERPEEVHRVLFERRNAATGEVAPMDGFSYGDLEDLRGLPGVSGAGGWSGPREQTVGFGPEAARAEVAGASHDLFATLGVQPAVGRFFTPDEDALHATPVAVLGWDRWQSAHGGSPDVLGTTIDLDGVAHTVIGVAPRGFTGVELARVDVWLPLVPYGVMVWQTDAFVESRGFYWMSAVARVPEQESLPALEERATVVHRAARAEATDGRADADTRVVTAPLIRARGPLASDEAKVATWLLGVTMLVLLIACANVANLLFARAEQRRREQAVRRSLGISKLGLLRAVLLEALLLSAAGGVLALVVAREGAVVIQRLLIPGADGLGEASTGPLVLVVGALALFAALASGLGPALRASRTDLADELRNGGLDGSRRRARVRDGLAVAQVALSVVLLVGAGLFLRSLHEVRTLDLGIDTDRLLTATFEIPGATPTPMSPPAAAGARTTAVLEEAAAIARRTPGVASASLSLVPWGWAFSERVRVPGLDSIPVLPGGGPEWAGVDEHYFATMGLEVLRGRGLEASDRMDGANVAVVNETMARVIWPGQDAVGQCLMRSGDADAPCTTIVGVVEDASRGQLVDDAFMMYYVPLTSASLPRVLYVRAEGAAETLAPRLSETLRSFSPDVRWAEVRTLREALDPQARAWSLGATLFTAFGALALLVAAVGLYSLLAFDVADRRRDLAIRSVLGADRGRLLAGVVRRGTTLTLAGVTLGVGLAVWLAPRVEGLLFEVAARDPAVLAAAGLVLLAAGTLASWVPGRRATRVDPMTVLRGD